VSEHTRILSIHSFRGGTGKSNTSANLAAALALGGLRVGIVDTDIQSPGVHVLFGLDRVATSAAGRSALPTLNDYLWQRCAVEEAAHDVTPSEVAVAGGTLFLVPSSLKPGEIARVLREGYDVDRLSDGFTRLGQALALDYLLIDTHPGLNEETLLSIALSHQLLVMLRPDRQDFLGTAVTVDVARKLGVARMGLVLNKVLPRLDAAVLRDDLERSFATELAAVFPETEDLLALGSADLFTLRQPDHPYSLEMRRLADWVGADGHPPEDPAR
jgi:MinD-like ATPase involved in chromosome partitioning or flagellar assembly